MSNPLVEALQKIAHINAGGYENDGTFTENETGKIAREALRTWKEPTGLRTIKSANEFWKTKFNECPQSDAEKLAVTMMAEYRNYILEEEPQRKEDELWDELINDFDTADNQSYGYAFVRNKLKSKFSIRKISGSEPEKGGESK
jgi:hypothetical protein